MSGLITDPKAEQRSLMRAQKCICNGGKTSRKCRFYWRIVRDVASNDPDNLKDGERLRICMRLGPGYEGTEMNEDQLPFVCSEFVPLKKPWFPWTADKGAFNAAEEDYVPLTPRQIQQIQDKDPSDEVKYNPWAEMNALKEGLDQDLQADLRAISRRSMHEFNAPHDKCVNPSFCSCDCKGCQATWENVGKPTPQNPRPEDVEALQPKAKVSLADARKRLQLREGANGETNANDDA